MCSGGYFTEKHHSKGTVDDYFIVTAVITVVVIDRKISIHWVRKFKEYQHSCRNTRNHSDSISGTFDRHITETPA